MFAVAASLLAFSTAVHAAATYSTTYSVGNLPDTSEQGQYGTNNCGTGSSQDSLCQVAYINSIEDFCVWGPPHSDGKNATIGETEREEVAWCMKAGYGTRLIPDGTIIGAHWVQTPDYVQITGNGDFTKIGVPKGDAGGELDPHGADGNGNPIGGLVFGNSFGTMIQYHEWTNFMSVNEFCFRACKPGENAAKLCQHTYDVMGCQWNMPADYSNGVFDSCLGDTGLPMGIYGTSTFHQGDGRTPPPHPKPSTYSCTTTASLTAVNVASTTPAPSASMTVITSGSVVITLATTSAAASAATVTASSQSGASPMAGTSAWTLAVGVIGALVGAAVAL